MANMNNELKAAELDAVAGGMPFYGANCSVNRNELIGAIDGFVSGLPVVGGFLSAVVTAVGQRICGT